MQDLSTRNFGIVVAYILPGATVLFATAANSETVQAWLARQTSPVPAISGILYGVPAALGCGLVVSALRWLVFDSLHHVTGVTKPAWDDRMLSERLTAFQYLVENHYRYYQFYANMLTAVIVGCWLSRDAMQREASAAAYLSIAILCFVLFAGSRDSLRKYYARVERLLGTISPGKDVVMTNGNHVAETAGNGPRQGPKQAAKTGKEGEPVKRQVANSKGK